MDGLIILAQETPWWADGTTTVLGRVVPYPPYVAIPAFLLALALLAVLCERVVVVVLRRMTAKTETKVDDAIAEGIPTILRPVLVLLGLHVLIHSLLRSEANPDRLSPAGEMASQALVVVSIGVVAIAVTRVVLRAIDAWSADEERRRPLAAPFKFGVKVVMVPLTLLTVLEALQVHITSLLAALSIGSLAVGLALQDTLKNMFAGIQIVLDQPIRAGDQVQIDQTVKGTVVEIGLRSTKLRGADNNTVIIPNATIADAVITNIDFHDRSYYQSFAVSVAYGSDTRRVQKILEEVVAGAAKELDGVVAEAPRIGFNAMAESSLDFTIEVRFRQWAGRMALVTEIYHRIYARLCQEGIEIPFPTRTVYVRNETPAAPTAS